MSRVRDAIAALRGRPTMLDPVETMREPGFGHDMVVWLNRNGLAAGDLVKAVREGGKITDLSEIAAGRQPLDPSMGAPWSSDEPMFNTGQMGPGTPAQPFPLGGEPRLYQYRVGRNLAVPPDQDRNVDSQLLRTLADSYDLLRKCIEVMKAEISALEWDIVPKEKNRKKREQWIAQNGDDLERIKQFFLWPEAYVTRDGKGEWVRRGTMGWQRWLAALLEDYYVGDFLTIWPRMLRNGDLLGFDRVDGSTVKPIIDLEGRIPPPPLPAYQQYLYGVPRASFTVEELLYRPKTVRNHTVYGFSHVEQMLVLINVALRFQMWNTQGFTEGSLPIGLLTFPEGYTPDQINAVVDVLNAATSGLAGERQKFHGVPFGTVWSAIKPFDFDETFAQYIVEYTCALFGLNAQKLGFMPSRGGSGLGGTGFAEQQAENADSHELIPTARWVQSLMNELIERYFDRNDVVFEFTTLTDDDEKELIETNKEALFSGQKSLDQILQDAGEEPVGVDRFVVIGNLPWSIADLKAIQDPEGDGKDYERTQAPGLPIYDDGEDDQGPGGDVPALPAGGNDGSGGVAQPPRPARTGERAPSEPAAGKPKAKDTTEQEPQPQEDDRDATATKSFDLSSGFQPHGLAAPGGRVEELRRWKRKAKKDAREGRPARPFRSDVLPDAMKTAIADELEHAADVAAVGAIFDREIAKAAEQHPMGQEGLEWAHYRPATDLQRCGNCGFFRAGVCSMFNAPVEVDHVCDEFEARPRYLTIDEARAAGGKAAAGDETLPLAEVAGIVLLAEDTGRVLMLQRSILDDSDPAAGRWEFPGGHVEDGEAPLEGAIREWQEETGAQLPAGGDFRGGWRSGIYEAFIYAIPHEADLNINLDQDDRQVLNPDDPDGDCIEVVAWWDPADLPEMPALRDEVRDGSDWDAIDRATPASKTASKAAVVGTEQSRKERTARHEHEAEAAIGALVLAKRRAARVASNASEARGQLALNAGEIRGLGDQLARAREGAYTVGANQMLARLGKDPLARIPALDQMKVAERAAQTAQGFAVAYHQQLDRLAAADGATPDNVVDGVARFQQWKAHQVAVSNATGGYNTGALAVSSREGLQSVVWATEHDDKVCPDCDDRDGQAFDLVDALVMGDEGLHPGCRCEWELNADELGAADL